jgi:hypothetical protein
MKCDCELWDVGIKQITQAQSLGWTHGYKYTGGAFVYCPWCGKKLTESKDQSKSD